MLYLSESDVDGLLTPPAAFAAIEAALLRSSADDVEDPPRVRLPFADGDYALRGCLDRELGYAGLTAVVGSPAGATTVMALFALEGARLEAVVEARRLTQLRTGATSAIAARSLARSDAASLGVIGCGGQAVGQVAALREVLPALTRVAVSCRDRGRLEAFCEENGCEPAESNQDVAASDVVVTATSACDPVLRGEWLLDGALVCAVGANEPTRRELDTVVLERASFVCCDSRERAALEAGDLIEPVAQGVLDWLEVHELHAVVAGELAGRASDADVAVFKACGFATADLALAVALLELARDSGGGRSLEGGR